MSDIIVRAATAADHAAFSPLRSAHSATGSDGATFVAERSGVIAGSVRVRLSIGLELPRYWYHVGSVVHAAAELRLFHQQRTLLLNNDHTGAGELIDLACDQSLDAQAQEATLRMLVRSALASLRGHCTSAIVELPGVRDASGRAPFWNGLGRHFYDGDPHHAAERFGEAWISHVAALLPRDPLIVSFLPQEAQAAIGAIVPEAQILVRALLAEGFRTSRYVTVDDAGPVLEIEIGP